MFDYLKANDDGIRLDAVMICFCLGCVPLVIAWGQYNTAFTEWLLQTYFMSFMVFIDYPRRYQRRNLRRAWFWKAMLLAAIVLHPAILAGMWFVDVSTKTKWHDTATIVSICVMASILEFAVLAKIVSYFRPKEEAPDASNARVGQV
jgi:hypothetical protein